MSQSSQKKDGEDVPFPNYAKFLVAGTGGMMAAFCVHPMDFIKTRMQMSGAGTKEKLYKTSGEALVKIMKTEGALAVYNGATACLLRQAIYTTTRLGVYTTLFGFFSKDGNPPGFTTKASIGMFSGLCAGFIATPTDLSVIRMITDGAKPENERFRYKHVFEALYRIGQEGGLKGLYRGAVPTTVRAVVVNGTVLATYSQSKEILKSYGQEEGLLLHFYASMISGFITTIVTLPVDIVKTRVQAQKSGEAQLTIGGICADVYQREGVIAFWKGFTPYFIRLAPITVLTFIFVEKLTYYYHIYVLGNKNPKSNM